MQERSLKLPRFVAAALLIASLGGCSMNPSSGASDPSGPSARPAADVLPEMEGILPELLALGGEESPLAIEELREESCLDPVQDDKWNTESRTLGWLLGRYMDAEAAQATMDAWKSQLESEGWVQDDETRNPPETNGFVHVMRYHRDDLQLLARYDHAERDGSRIVDVVITSPCTKNPEDHQMIRSALDPGYGLHSSYYDYAAEEQP